MTIFKRSQGPLITAFYNWLLLCKPTRTSTPSPTGTQTDMTTGTAITRGSTSAKAAPLPVLDICKSWSLTRLWWHENHTEQGICSNIRMVRNSATERSYAAPALKWRDTYRIAVHTIPDIDFRVSTKNYSVWCEHGLNFQNCRWEPQRSPQRTF